MIYHPFVRLTVLSAFLLAASVFAQWPASPDTNLVICNHAGEQTVPKVAATSDGGCYICWFDLLSGNYDVYLQRLDGNGIPQWTRNGILISDHPQDTWITDYDMTVDAADHAIIVFNDIRAGDDWDIYAYRISPAGVFVWGPDGIAISDNGDFEPSPRVTVTMGGNIVIAWQQETDAGMVVNLRKLTPAGVDVWTPNTMTLTNGINGLSIPRIAPAENDGVIVQYLKHLGPEFWAIRHICMQKFDSFGTAQWPASGVVVSDAGGIGVQMKPDMLADGAGGAYSYWYDSRDNTLHAFAQHIAANGAPLWTRNGVIVSTSGTQLQMDPALCISADNQGVMLFYMIASPNQSEWGVGGQRIGNDGTVQWTSNGQDFIPLGDQQRHDIQAATCGNGAIVTYIEYAPGSQVDSRIKAFRVASDGSLVWAASPISLTLTVSPKGYLVSTRNDTGQVIAVWQENRGGVSPDIFLQNVNPDGSFGPYNPQPEPSLQITAPHEGAQVSDLPLTVHYDIEDFAVGEPLADGVVELKVNGTVIGWYTNPDSVLVTQLTQGNNSIVLELVDQSHAPLNPRAGDSLHVSYEPSGIPEHRADMPLQTQLLPAWPNPFNPTTMICFGLTRSEFVRITVYDILGRQAAILAEGVRPVGFHNVIFDASPLSGGLYFCRMETSSFSATTKLLLIK
ncbi:T9SS C-terminal target domain-containing protein [candidate division KSB1 bacterium]|nr:MAG: T9SS C-terminal target domain-containing protein [candidate division KSB1 bacterium]